MNSAARAPSRVVVMGATGFIGRAFQRQLEAAGIPVLGLSRAEVDLLQPDAARTLAARLKADDAFVAIAGLAPIKTPARLRDSLVVVEAMAEALRMQPVSHVLNLGSDSVFADSDEPITEASCRSPDSLYGVAHLAREIMLSEAAGDAPMATLRPTVLFGAGDNYSGYGSNRFRRQASLGEPITLFGSGKERRDHVWLEDLAALAVLILQRRSRGALNAASGTSLSFRDVADAVASHYTPKPAIVEVAAAGSDHSESRLFDPAATYEAFPDFVYTHPLEAFRRIHEGRTERH